MSAPVWTWPAGAGAALLLLAAACSSAVTSGLPSPSPADPGSLPRTSPVPVESPAVTVGERRTIYDDRNTTLRGVRFFEAGWRTDFTRHSVPLTEIRRATGSRDSVIPAIDSPAFTPVDEAVDWPRSFHFVIALELKGEARAYPVPILDWHEIVNDVVAGVPVAVTFCPLCNSALVFDRRLDGVVYDFGVSGNLRNSGLIMYDRQTHSWWQQFTGEGIVGELTGKQLRILPAAMLSWTDFKASYPNGAVLSRDTGFDRDYDRDPYLTDDGADLSPIFLDEVDGRLPIKEKVVGVNLGGLAVAFPYTVLGKEGVVNFTAGARNLVVFLKRSHPGTGRATGAFDPRVEEDDLTFSLDGERLVDDQTGSEWNILGEAVAGPLAGKRMEQIVHGDHFWFAWAAFNPDTIIYGGGRTDS